MNPWIEAAFIVAFTLAWPLVELITVRRVRTRMTSALPGGRATHYVHLMLAEWLSTAAAIAIVLASRRPWANLGLRIPAPSGLVWTLVVIGLAVALIATQTRIALGSEQGRRAARAELARFGWMLPRDRHEVKMFTALSVTAGVCEEILFRGYLPGVLTPWLGPIGAVLVSVVLFGLGHTYLGRSGAIRSTLGGVVFTLLYLLTGSLVAPAVVHALLDWSGGEIAYRLATESRPRPGLVAAPQSG